MPLKWGIMLCMEGYCNDVVLQRCCCRSNEVSKILSAGYVYTSALKSALVVKYDSHFFPT